MSGPLFLERNNRSTVAIRPPQLLFCGELLHALFGRSLYVVYQSEIPKGKCCALTLLLSNTDPVAQHPKSCFSPSTYPTYSSCGRLNLLPVVRYVKLGYLHGKREASKLRTLNICHLTSESTVEPMHKLKQIMMTVRCTTQLHIAHCSNCHERGVTVTRIVLIVVVVVFIYALFFILVMKVWYGFGTMV